MTITSAIVPAGGAGLRMGQDLPKQFLELAGLPVLVHTLKALHRVSSLSTIIIAAPAEHLEYVGGLVKKFDLDKVSHIVAGGRTRQDSVRAALRVLPAEVDFVVVHDGVRPLVEPQLVEECLSTAKSTGAAIAALPVKDTMKFVDTRNFVVNTVSRESLWQAQTPQVIRADLMKKAFANADKHGFEGTDEASLLEKSKIPVSIVAGSETNIKVTRPADLRLAASLMQRHNSGGEVVGVLRVGHGYDAHLLQEGRKLVLGGVTVPHERGLVGHSDADVVLHALCDAMLGAAGLGDIGRHFPDSDKSYKDISSLLILKKVIDILAENGFKLGNADITVVAQQPKLAPYFSAMIDNIATTCGVDRLIINLKATTTEEMGFAGRQEGIAAYAVVTLSGDV